MFLVKKNVLATIGNYFFNFTQLTLPNAPNEDLVRGGRVVALPSAPNEDLVRGGDVSQLFPAVLIMKTWSGWDVLLLSQRS